MRENYYILLGLNPSIKDEVKINEAITKAQSEWSFLGTHPSSGLLAKQNLSKIPDILTVLLNPESREIESQEAKKILIEKEQAKNKDLILAGSFLVKNGEISEKDLNALLKKPKYKDFQKEQVLNILSVKLKKEERPYKDDGIRLLDESIMKKIRSDLNILNKKDLFDFLSLSPTSSCRLLIQKADEIYNSSSRNANKTAEVTATNSLASQCQTYLKDELIKECYHKSNDYESFTEIKVLIDLAANDGVIDASEFEKLISECSKKKIFNDRAELFIYSYCNKKTPQININRGDNPEYKKQIQCNVCCHLNDPTANNCGYCASPLKVICPKCNHKANSIEKACVNCGFFIGDMPNAIYLVRDADVELSKGNIELAEKLIKESEIYWPGYHYANVIREKISQTSKQIKLIVTDIDKLVDGKKFVASKFKISELKNINETHKYIEIYEKKINDQIILAKNICKQAKAEPNNDKKLDLFLSALETCSDLNEAIIGSSILPIEPPTNLKISKKNKVITLQWLPPQNKRALKYRIIRKNNSKPTGFSDGEILAEISNLMYEDFDVVTGKSYYYSIYSVRGTSFSEVAVTQGPILLVEDINNLSAISGDASITFKWEITRLVKRIEIFCTDNHNHTKYGQGKKTISQSLNNFTDFNLINEKEYFYSFYSVYEDCLGTELISDGVTISVIPSAPPPPINSLSYTINQKRVNLKWTPPKKGSVQIIRSLNKLSHFIGSVISFEEIQKLGNILSNISNASAFFDIDFQGQIVLTPLIIFNRNAIIGQEIYITSIGEVSNIKSQLSGGKLYLEWDWPIDCDLVQIKYSHVDFPSNERISNPTTINFTKEQYFKNNAYTINQPVNKDYYFTICTCSKVAGENFYSNGVNELVVISDPISIGYKIRVKKLFGKAAFIELKCQQKIIIPEIMVIIKYSGIPLSKFDGSCIMKIDNQTIKNTTRIEIPLIHIAKEKYIKLFFTDDSNNKKYRLLMPQKEELELN